MPRTMLALFALLCHVLGARGDATSEAAPSGMITGTVQLQDASPLGSVMVSLNAGAVSTYTDAGGHFVFYEVPAGVYLLDVLSPTHAFSQLKIKVQEGQEPAVVENRFPGAPIARGRYPVVLTAHAKFNFFEKKQAFGIGTLLKSPMAFTVLMTLGMVIILPRMMSGVNQEELKEMQKQMNANGGGDPSQLLNKLLGRKEADDDDD